MSAAERLAELRLQLEKAEREPATRAGNDDQRWLSKQIAELEAERDK